MKEFVIDFLKRGSMAAGVGPLVLAMIYLILHYSAGLAQVSVNEVCTGIVSLTVLSFVSGGMNAIYQIERLPLMLAIMIHGTVLYTGYLATYLINDWLDIGMWPIIVFTAIFIVGYIVIWLIIYSIIKRNTNKINEMLKQNQR